MIIKILFFVTLFTFLYADELVYLNGKHYFDTKQYKKAFPLLQKEAKNGLKPSMYRLAYMYENGLGMKINYKKATYWYKKLSNSYSYTVVTSQDNNDSEEFLTKLSNQMEEKTNKEAANFAISKIDNTPETRNLMDSLWRGNFFGIEPYHENYLLPISVSSNGYSRYNSLIPPHSNLSPMQEKYNHYKTTEVEFQISLKKQLSYNLFGWNEFVFFTFTERAWFQIYSKSAPFREINYLPELFMSVPSSDYFDRHYGLKAIRYGYLHDSNGQDGYRSRSWNRLYINALWEWDNLFLASRIWYRIPEHKKSQYYYEGKGITPNGTPIDPNESGDDNPNIQDYLGYGDLSFHYLYKKHQFGSLLRYNFGSGGKNRGAVEINWSYPFFHSKNMFWYAKIFNGYGESLIDYNHYVTKTSFGFSFSRPLF